MLVCRYKHAYGIPQQVDLTEDMVLRHWTLERRLTNELLASDPEHRWEVFERCYTALYRELPWLNDLVGTAPSGPTVDDAEDWARLIGPPPARVYEVGSGKGRLIAALAERGYDCTATEITRERGEKWAAAQQPLRWTISDGVHLDRFEEPESYHAVISDQVIEHLHPDDLRTHFRGALAILRRGGRYVFGTPHAFEGPFDVSRVFGSDHPQGMHLKEYTYSELRTALRDSGFTSIATSFRLPRVVRARCGGKPRPFPSRVYFAYLRRLEQIVASLPRGARRKVARALRPALWPSGITLVAFKE